MRYVRSLLGILTRKEFDGVSLKDAQTTQPKWKRGASLVRDKRPVYRAMTLLDALKTTVLSDAKGRFPHTRIGRCVIQVDRMLDNSRTVQNYGVEYWAVNTDTQALGRSKVAGANVLAIGAAVTRGLGAGGDPAIGQRAALENIPDLAAIVKDWLGGSSRRFASGQTVGGVDNRHCHETLCV
jgi:hypothetical protein